MAFPTGAFFRVNNHQGLPFLLGALHVYDAKPLHFHAGTKRVVEIEATAQQRESQTSPTLFAWPLKARTWAALLCGTSQTDPQNNCATGSPIHLIVAAFFRTPLPTDVSIARVFLSHALSSNDHTDTRVCHAHHTEDKGKGRPANSDHTICCLEGAQVLLQHQQPSVTMLGPLYLGSSHLLERLSALLSPFVQERFERGLVCEFGGHALCMARGGTLDLQGRRDHQ